MGSELCYYSTGFDFKICIRARKVSRSFGKRAAGRQKLSQWPCWNHMGLGGTEIGTLRNELSKMATGSWYFLSFSDLTRQIRIAGRQRHSDSLCETEAFHKARYQTSGCYSWYPERSYISKVITGNYFPFCMCHSERDHHTQSINQYLWKVFAPT